MPRTAHQRALASPLAGVGEVDAAELERRRSVDALPPEPTEAAMKVGERLLEPWRRRTDPLCLDFERVPQTGPAMLVGNHSVYGLQDAPVMIAELSRRRGVIPRALGDHAHFKVPLWGDLLRAYGVVDGTRENCRRLLRAGAVVLVYPGGGREVMKRRGEKYELLWKQRLGFARMAVEFGAPIVPFGAVGAEDTYDILIDGDSALAAPVRALIEALGGRPEIVPPIARGVGPTAVPRPERFYFGFGEPIETSAFAGRENEDAALRRVRDAARAGVEAQIERLLDLRAHDGPRGSA